MAMFWQLVASSPRPFEVGFDRMEYHFLRCNSEENILTLVLIWRQTTFIGTFYLYLCPEPISGVFHTSCGIPYILGGPLKSDGILRSIMILIEPISVYSNPIKYNEMGSNWAHVIKEVKIGNKFATQLAWTLRMSTFISFPTVCLKYRSYLFVDTL